MIVSNDHESLYFSDKIVDKADFHFLKVVFNVLVHILNIGHYFSDFMDHL